MKLKFSNEWLQQKIENEPEGLTVEAGALELTSDEFALLCENPPTYEALELEIKLLKAELKQKDKKLSELQNGIDIEEAKDGGDYYCLFGGTPYKAEQCRVSGKWFLIRSMPEAGIMPERLYPLPSTETKEGS